MKDKTQNIITQANKYLACLILLISLLAPMQPVHSQVVSTKPIIVTPILTPPYSLNLSEYGAIGSQKLMVNLQIGGSAKDGSFPIKLRVTIQSVSGNLKIYNPPNLAVSPIYVDYGIPSMLFGSDLEPYFSLENLVFEGSYSKEAYRRSGQLPEGVYMFTVEVLNYRDEKLISNQGTATAWMALGQPPLLLYPHNDAQMGENPDMPITFQWNSPNVAAPHSSIGYELRIWELEEGELANAVVDYRTPFYDSSVEGLIYDRMKNVYTNTLNFKQGFRYAWRITAVDASGYVPFAQGGNSEVRTFTFKSACDPITDISSTVISSTEASISWVQAPNNTSFISEMYNEADELLVTSYPNDEALLEFDELTPGATYKIRTSGVCYHDENITSEPSEWESFTMPQSDNIEDTACVDCKCEPYTLASISNQEPREDLQVDDIIYDGNNKLRITTLEDNGDGTYSGELEFCMDIWGIKIKCNYTSLKVNTDSVMIGGHYESIYDEESLLLVDVDAVRSTILEGIDVTVAGYYVGNIEDGVDSAAFTFSEPLDGVSENKFKINSDGDLEISGGTVEGTMDNPEYGTTVEDSEGNIYAVETNEEGTEVTSVTKIGASGSTTTSSSYNSTAKTLNRLGQSSSNDESRDETARIIFSNPENEIWAYDPGDAIYDGTRYGKEYQKIDDYRVGWKLVPIGKYGTITASLQGAGVTASDVQFISPTGLTLEAEWTGSSCTLTLPAARQGDGYEVYAYIDKALEADSSSQEADIEQITLGKLQVASYPIMERSLRIYDLSENGVDVNSIAAKVNVIYEPYGIVWQVEARAALDDTSWDTDNDGKVSTSETGLFSAFSEEMKALFTVYKQDSFDPDASYIFIVDGLTTTGLNGLLGDMPIGYPYGFVAHSEDEDAIAHTIAHELGHGNLQLEHTFDDVAQGTTSNLMDYADDVNLVKRQWDLIHDPQNMIFAWAQDEEEGAMVVENHTSALSRLIKTINCAHNNGKKKVKLYLPSSTIRGKVSGLVSEFYLAGNPCTEDAEIKATLYEMFGEVVDLSNDYVEDIFSLEDVGYDESNKIITFTGNKYKLLITGEEDALCAYNFAKNNLFGSLHTPRTPINFASLEDLQYSSPCELEYLSIDSRKDLLQKIQSETNWYNGSLKDSRQKITINVIATTHEDDKGNLLTFFDTNKDLLKNLYDRIDDYRGEFVEEVNNLYQNGKGALNTSTVVALGIRPGVTIEDKPWYQDFNFLWRKLNLKREHISAEYISSEQVSVILKEYHGPSGGLPSLFAEGEVLCKGAPFDIIQGIDQQSGKVIDVPLICFLHESEETDREVMYNDALTVGKLGVDAALIYFSVRNLQGASAILKSEVTAQNVARLILGFGDVATLGLGKVCESDNSEFCQAYKDYEFYINMGLLSANILNEFPQIYKNLKKGLDDPTLTKEQKDGLRKVLGEADDILSQRQDFWTTYKSKYFPDGDWGKTEFVTEGIDYNTFKNSNPVICNEMAAKYGSSEIAEEYLPGLIESGSSIPTKVILNKGDELYKIVPSGSDISDLSPYYLSKAEVNFVKQNPEKLEQVLGLPLSSCSGKYEVYKIVAKENNLTVFEANIAPTKQYLKSNPSDFYSTTGGRKQTLLIDNGDTDLWEKSSSAIGVIEPTVLPVIK